MGKCHYKHVIFTAVILLNLLSRGNSQSGNGPPRRIFENAPSGISADAEEKQYRGSKPLRVFINGPTGFSVDAERKNRDFEEVEEDLRDSNDSPGPMFVESDVDLDKIDNDPDALHFVNGHAGQSVHKQELEAAGNRKVIPTDQEGSKEAQLRKGLHIYTTDWSRDSSEWSFKGGEWSLVNLPDKTNHPGLPAPPVPGPALVVVTDNSLSKVHAFRKLEDLENVTLHFSYYLSEGEPPHGVPELDVYQVKDDQTRLVSSEKNHGTWSESTIPLPLSGSSKIVFVGRLNENGNEIAIDDITIKGYSGTNSEAGIAGEKTENDTNESGEGDSSNAGETHKASSSPEEEPRLENGQQGVNNVSKALENIVTEGEAPPEMTHAAAGMTTEAVEEHRTGTENSNKSEMGTSRSQMPDLTTPGSSDLAQGNNTYNTLSDNNPGIGDGSNSTNNLYNNAGNESLIPMTTDSVVRTNASLIHTEEPLIHTEESLIHTDEPLTNTDESLTHTDEFIPDHETNSSNETYENFEGVPEVSNYSNDSTEAPQTNLTNLNYFTTDDVIEVPGDGNNSEMPEDTNFTSLVTDSIFSNDTDAPNNFANTMLTSDIIEESTAAPFNQTGPAITTNSTNLSGYVGNNTTGNVNATISSNLTAVLGTAGFPNTSATNFPNLGNSSDGSITTPLIMTSSNFPPGGINESSGVTTGNENATVISVGSANSSSSSSWSAFKIFLVVGLLGVVIMGFLYWRRQRRRDDEIPVFSRSSHADYLNPSFSDDDANFASRGTSHNYKSFD